MQTAKTKTQINPLILAIAFVVIIFIVLLIITLANLLRINPYGNSIKIDNLTAEYSDLPQNEQDLISSELYNIVADNTESGVAIPSSGAIVRQGTSIYDYDPTLLVHSGSFIVDIPDIEQSYLVQFEWSPKANSQGLGGYPVMISCLPKSQQIYQTSTVCKDTLNQKTVTWKNEYQIDYSFGISASYQIREIIDNFLINDNQTLDKYDAVLDETSLTRINNISDPTFSFALALNSASRYIATARTDELYGEKYIAVYIYDENSPSNYFAAIRTSDESTKQNLSAWLQETSKNENLKIEYQDLSHK